MIGEKGKYLFFETLIALVLGLLFELKPILLLVVVGVFAACVPKIRIHQEKSTFEKQRFHDINAYMSQMAQSFVHTQDIIQSLEETASCFSNGRMHDTLEEALAILEAGKWDIRRAERDALSYIEEHYSCEKLKNLHNFFLRAEEIGGSCQKEFQILERMRLSWQGVVESIRLHRVMERNVGTLIYIFFLLVCMLMLRIMKGSNLDIITFYSTQMISMTMILGLAFYLLFMERRLSKSLLVDFAEMSEERAMAYFDYLAQYDERKERKKYASLAVLSLIAAGLFLYNKPDGITLAISLCIVFAGFHVHTFVHISAIHTMRTEIAKAFPKWLFDLMLLLQRESVEGAMEQSVETAPPVLKNEICHMNELLSMKPHDPEVYMSFLKDFSNPNINEMMHKLYSLAVGANRDSEVLDVVIEKNIIYLEKAERDNMLFQDSMKTFTWIPFLCAGFGCMGYLVIAIVTSISGIIDLIGR